MQHDFHTITCTYFSLCLFIVLRPAQEFFTYMETLKKNTIAGEGPMLGAQGL
jgi:hypothetical protein